MKKNASSSSWTVRARAGCCHRSTRPASTGASATGVNHLLDCRAASPHPYSASLPEVSQKSACRKVTEPLICAAAVAVAAKQPGHSPAARPFSPPVPSPCDAPLSQSNRKGAHLVGTVVTLTLSSAAPIHPPRPKLRCVCQHLASRSACTQAVASRPPAAAACRACRVTTRGPRPPSPSTTRCAPPRERGAPE